MKPARGQRLYTVIERSTGDVVSSHVTRQDAQRAMREYGKGFRVVTFPKPNPGDRKLTKKQRKARAKRAGTTRRKSNAVKVFLKKMNPSGSMKNVVGARIKRLKGGGFSVIPVRKKRSKA